MKSYLNFRKILKIHVIFLSIFLICLTFAFIFYAFKQDVLLNITTIVIVVLLFVLTLQTKLIQADRIVMTQKEMIVYNHKGKNIVSQLFSSTHRVEILLDSIISYEYVDLSKKLTLNLQDDTYVIDLFGYRERSIKEILNQVKKKD